MFDLANLILIGYLHVFMFFWTLTSDINTLSLHDALPICLAKHLKRAGPVTLDRVVRAPGVLQTDEELAEEENRSEEHTSELQSLRHLVCRLLLEKKQNNLFLIVQLQSIKRLLKLKYAVSP